MRLTLTLILINVTLVFGQEYYTISRSELILDKNFKKSFITAFRYVKKNDTLPLFVNEEIDSVSIESSKKKYKKDLILDHLSIPRGKIIVYYKLKINAENDFKVLMDSTKNAQNEYFGLVKSGIAITLKDKKMELYFMNSYDNTVIDEKKTLIYLKNKKGRYDNIIYIGGTQVIIK